MSTVRVYTDCGRMIPRSERTISKIESDNIESHIESLRSLFADGLMAVPTDYGFTLVPLNRVHVIDIDAPKGSAEQEAS